MSGPLGGGGGFFLTHTVYLHAVLLFRWWNLWIWSD